MHRETTVSREIKLIKNKFELLEKSRQFKSILQKSNAVHLGSLESNEALSNGSTVANESGELLADQIEGSDESKLARSSHDAIRSKQTTRKRVLFDLGRVKFLSKLLSSFNDLRQLNLFRKRPNRVSTVSIVEPAKGDLTMVNPDNKAAHEYVEDHELQTSRHEQLDTGESEIMGDK